MGYRVIKYFTDLRDNSYEYHVGDTFPHDGIVIDDARLEELSTNKNRRGIPLIEKIKENPVTKENAPAEPKKKRTKKNAE